MSEPINLNRARKARTKAQAQEAAAHNRVRFGRTKAEREAAKVATEKAARTLDQARRED